MVNGVTILTPDEAKRLTDERGTRFGTGERLFGSFTNDDVVSLAYDVTATDMAKMLASDGNARKIERVLSIPIRGAAWHITGDSPAADLIRDNLGPHLGRIIEQCTGAITYRRTYFEKVWTVDPQGRIVYDKVAWRPPQSCTPRFDRRTGEELGFYQRSTDTGWWSTSVAARDGDIPGQVTIPTHKAFVYVHGRHREPVRGVSDLEVAFNVYEKKRKLKWLWGRYLESRSMPWVAAYGLDDSEAQRNAEMLAQSQSGGIVPMTRDPGSDRPWDVIEGSGQGSSQFQEAIRYYDWEMTASVLAGFTELANAAASGTGSYALSADQSEFFLASEQAVADEIADQIVEGLFRPLTVLNFGPDAQVPTLRIGPVGNKQTDRALDLVKTVIGANRPTVPYEFTGFLLNAVAESLGLDDTATAEVVTAWGARQQAEVEAAQAAQVAAAAQLKPMPAPSQQQPLPGAPEATRERARLVAAGHDPDSGASEVGAVTLDAAPARHPSKRDRRRKRR